MTKDNSGLLAKGLLNIQADHIIRTAKEELNAHGIGKYCSFNSEGLRIVDLNKSLKENFIYNDLVIYTDDKSYYIVKNKYLLYQGYLFYQGMIDKEGTEKEIINDISETQDFMNYMILVANEDKEALVELMSDVDFMMKLNEQIQSWG
ncbi:hypothetical protein [Bacillus sp. NPDC094106]|uniref:hypothetical protein n=1 Tax=Bacillus sp. NPDC094106 TaxID=3363949 RepID=UPI0038184121